jgi:hypothetical protein
MKDQKELREEQKAMRALIESPSPSKARGINHAVQRCIRQLLFTGCFKDVSIASFFLIVVFCTLTFSCACAVLHL